MTTTRYKIGSTYSFRFVSGALERVEYLGKNSRGMLRLRFATGEVWTGYAAPITEAA